MIIKFISKIKNIFKGWYYDLFNKNHNLYEDRIKFCNACEYHECLGKNFWICNLCGCPTSKKTRVKEEKCSQNKW